MILALNTDKTIGGLLVAGAIAVFIPYTALTIIFNYPDILRQDTAFILTKFHEGGNTLIWMWFAFAIAGLPLLPAYILIGQRLEHRSLIARIATNIGVIGLVLQMIGLLRWTFVIPILSHLFVHAPDEAPQAAAVVAFTTIHQFGGVLLGEHMGQLFTIVWTVMISLSFTKTKRFPAWLSWLGYGSSLVYFFAQAELPSTVMPELPFWDLAGFSGSTLWLIRLIVTGIFFFKTKAAAAVIH